MPGIEDLTLLAFLMLLGIMLVAGLVHGMLGLGFAIVATPPLALLTDVRSAILITLFPTLTVNIASMLDGGAWRLSIGRFWPLGIYVALGSVVGTKLLLVSDPAPFKLLLAAIILAYLYVQRLAPQRPDLAKPRPAIALMLLGLTAGFLAGTVNVMVPVLILFFLNTGLGPTAMVQVFNLCFFAAKLTQVGVFTLAGALDNRLASATAPLAAAALLSLLIGMAVRTRIEAATYRRWLQGVLFVIALLLLVQYGVG
jgi:uncharacterized membrane protein YfcA